MRLGVHLGPTVGERNWVFEACAGTQETADTQQRSPTHSPRGRSACLEARRPACSMHCAGERAAARAPVREVRKV